MKSWLAAIASAVVFSSLFWLSRNLTPRQIELFLEKFGFSAPLMYILVMASTQIAAPISGTVIYFAGFVLFGSRAQLYNYLATIFTAATNFWIARKWGRGLVKKLVGQKSLSKVDQFSQNYGFKTLIFLRVFQGNLHDFISYAYGLTKMKFKSYMVVSLLAPIPWLIVWQVFIFPRIENLAQFTAWYGLTLIPLLLVSVFFLAKIKNASKI